MLDTQERKASKSIQRPLRPNPDFRCARCMGTARPIDGRTVKGVKVDEEKLEAVSEFCYLSTGGGCELAAVTCCKASSANCCPFSLPQSASCEQR